MTGFLKVIGLLTIVLHCNGFRRRQQTDDFDKNEAVYRLGTARRFLFPKESVIIGAPSYPNHLPEAEPILPGHTLLRPGLGMLKSAVKFPHREMEGGSGVYGNWDNLGIRYDGRNERVLYTGFRRTNSEDPLVVFLSPRNHKTKAKKVTKKELWSRIIQDILKDQQYGNTKKSYDYEKYLSKNFRKSGRKGKKDKYKSEEENEQYSKSENERKEKNLSFTVALKVDVSLNGLKPALNETLKYWNLSELVNNKSNYIDTIINALQSSRRHKMNNKKKLRQQNDAAELNEKIFNETKEEDKEYELDENDKNNINEKSSSSEERNVTTISPVADPHSKEVHTKRELFWATKDQGNHIKISPHAIDFAEFQPQLTETEDLEQLQNWWYFNQADHTNLHEKRRHD